MELALGWQIATLPLVEAVQDAKEREGRQSTAAMVVKAIVILCRDENFMTMGPQGTGISRSLNASIFMDD